jgi:hypothetical protein
MSEHELVGEIRQLLQASPFTGEHFRAGRKK